MGTTKTALIKEAQAHGCELEIDTSGYAVEIAMTAPRGKLFKSSGCHTECGLHGHGNLPGFKPDWNQTRKDMLRVIADGFDDCTDPGCEFCSETE